MTRSNMLNVARTAARQASRRYSTTSFRPAAKKVMAATLIRTDIFQPRPAFSTYATMQKGMTPDSEDPKPKEAEPLSTTLEPLEVTNEQYHELSDVYIDSLVARLEELAEKREDVDVEYSAGVLTLTVPPMGTYVINKQPPNKQIWLSSPISGPKRFDYVVVGEGQNEKEGGGSGDWIYIRDGSLLSDIILKEIGVDVTATEV